MTPNKLWFGIFGLWLLFLSGALSGLVGSPGVIQALRLSSLLYQKHEQLMATESDIARLEVETALLETSHVVQEREVRRVLGYAAPDELIFDFAESEKPGVL